ncbi:hypothetical protein A2U01_0038644, partial [Trifolium medium]|nr:hypothetical protein [Trifolium medium]
MCGASTEEKKEEPSEEKDKAMTLEEEKQIVPHALLKTEERKTGEGEKYYNPEEKETSEQYVKLLEEEKALQTAEGEKDKEMTLEEEKQIVPQALL